MIGVGRSLTARLPLPQLVHFSLQKTIRTMGGNSMKMVVFTPSMLGASMYLTTPDHLGGRGNLAMEIQQTMQITGKSYAEVSKEASVIAWNVASRIDKIAIVARAQGPGDPYSWTASHV